MAGKKKNSGKKGGGAGPPGEQVIEFTPEGAFNIRTAAKRFAELMESTGQALIIHLQHVSIEFEAGCTAKEIIDGYNGAMRSIKPSNANVKGSK